MSGRTIVVGDVHGCRAELERLLSAVRLAPGDRLVFVGDLVARGPDSLGVLEVVRQTGAQVVRGNHEAKLLAWRSARPELRCDLPISKHHAELAASLREEDWQLLARSTLWVDLPAHGLRVVHAGVVPGVAIERQAERNLLHMRCLTADGEASEDKWSDAPLWGSRYSGPPHVVFGHNARAEAQLHRWATGIDTGCVYGGSLTALVLQEGEQLSQGTDVRTKLHQEKASRVHFIPGRAPPPNA